MTVYYVPGTILNAGDIAVNKNPADFLVPMQVTY